MSEGGETRNHEADEVEAVKRCTRCDVVKPLAEFYRRAAGSRDGYRSHCKVCNEEERREYRREHPARPKDWSGVARPSHKICRTCGERKPLSEYFNATTTRDGKEHDCKACHYGATKARRKANPKQERARQKRYQARNKNKNAARAAARRAAAAGRLVKPAHCERCDDTRTQAHHPDYSKPLEVIWLCQRCHAEEHARLREAA